MAEPMSEKRRAEIREEIDLGSGVLSDETAAELLAEVERLAPFEAESCALADQRDGAQTEAKQLRTERDEAVSKADRYFEHLRQAHPRHFTPNVLGERLCGCVKQWPCREHVQLDDAEARVLQAFTAADVDGLAVMTPAEATALVMAAIKNTEASQ